jgi:hypothetical protein
MDNVISYVQFIFIPILFVQTAMTYLKKYS